MKRLVYPFDEKTIRALKAGETVSLSGRVYTGRDKFHKYFAEGGKLPVDFRDGALYHCGPVVIERKNRAADDAQGRTVYSVLAAGPTTSVRENAYEPEFIRRSGVRIIIGKGGMDEKTLAAMKECGCLYLQAVGGAAALSAAAVKRVAGVSFLKEFGAAEALWHFDVEDFRGIVAMDAHGNSLFKRVAATSAGRYKSLTQQKNNTRKKQP